MKEEKGERERPQQGIGFKRFIHMLSSHPHKNAYITHSTVQEKIVATAAREWKKVVATTAAKGFVVQSVQKLF